MSFHRRQNQPFPRRLYRLLIEPRTHDERARWREIILNAVLATTIVVMAVALVAKLVQLVSTGRAAYPGAVVVMALVLIAAVGLHRLGRCGGLRGASYGVLTIYFLGADAAFAAWGAQVAIGYMSSVLVLLVANALLGSRTAAAVLLLQCLVWIGIVVLQRNDVIRPDTSWVSAKGGVGDVLTYAVPAAVIAAIAWASSREPIRSVDETLTGNSRDSPLRRLRTRTLTIREVQVVQLVAGGNTDEQIARELFISVRTVHTHVANAMRKTDSANRTALGVLAVREGLVPLADVDDRAAHANAG
jgi:DNA-binding CsgD family transcriptional regulator